MGQQEQAVGTQDGGDGKTGSAGVEGGTTPAGPSETHPYPKEAEKRVNPSAPAETGTTPGTNAT